MRLIEVRGRRAAAGVAAVACVAGLLAACTSGGPDPRDTAEALAKGLSRSDVSKVPSTAGGPTSQADLERIVASMDGAQAQVTVDDVSEDDDTATATLKTTWDLQGRPWSYTTTATLSLVDEAWKVEWKPSIVAPDLTVDDRLRVRTTAADRGDILGAGDQPLVTERAVLRIGLDKTKVDAAQVDASARALAAVVDIDAGEYATRAAAAGAQAFVPALVVRADATDAPRQQDVDAIAGAVAIDDTLPLAPTRSFGQPMLGAVGEATAEIVEKSKGAVQAGDTVGLSGLALRYDRQLRGTPGVRVESVSSVEGTQPVELFSGEAVAGKPLRTTIDIGLQGEADAILSDVGPASAIVAVRPSTGEVVALSSGPGGDGADTAAGGRFPPGSTFKLVTALALLRSGLTPSTEVPCTESITVDGRRFTNYSDYPSSAVGDIALRTAIANSCNTAMIAERDKAPQADLAGAAAALGLGPDVDLGYPAFLGSVPDTAEGTERAASMIGQGRIEASPLAMATVAASIAKGERVTPTLLADTPSKPAAAASAPLMSSEAAQLQELFRGVVTDGSGRFLADVPGGPVSAKTGTAEYGDDTPPRTHAWMIATQGDLAVAVFVADGESGSQTAGPLLEEFLRSAS
ncbi:penicillin-binding transpeptidase domain-containing protein [Aeromicrobium fastidiosum]|uniref:penicillin-binding transpeptidase domain-containing protein n=1 Tax=Aeromicrobium fastidiosum TaxID=52699 RepID=UPI0020238984|nr:penicillin-binding transpeptidase domain-containing protein [Aeromicrobium fastidiosum]MCL8250593.1 penicillin-binding transpeptidase domain-containing protein [Aeromicrobium fastidiosum]